MADKRAEKGRLRLSDANPIYQGPNKYGSLQLHVKAMCHSQVATAREKLVFILHSENAPNTQNFNRFAKVNLLLAQPAKAIAKFERLSNFAILFSHMVFWETQRNQ